jgi:hypothetical protein
LQKQFVDWDMSAPAAGNLSKQKKAPGRSWLRAQFHIAISPLIDLHRKVNQNMEVPAKTELPTCSISVSVMTLKDCSARETGAKIPNCLLAFLRDKIIYGH